MPRFQTGDHVKVEFLDEQTGQNEWMWVEVDGCDDKREVILGRLDSQPLIHSNLKVGQELAISYANVREHRRFQESKNSA